MERSSLGDQWAFGSRHPHWIRRRKGSLLATAVSLLMMVGVLGALADNVDSDGDSVASGANPLNLGTICVDQSRSGSPSVYVRATGHPGVGTNNFADGTIVTFSVTSTAVDATSPAGSSLGATVPAPPGNQITLDADWISQPNGSLSDAISSIVTVGAGSAAGSFTGTVNYRATGTRSTDATALTRNGSLPVVATISNTGVCAPATNNPPSVDAGGPYSGDEGSDIALDGASASDSDGTVASTVWSILDQSGVSPGSCSLSNASSLTAATINCTDNGVVTVRLTATDDDSASASADASVTVTNVAPSGTFNAPSANVSEGSSFTLSITGVTDPSSVDTFTYAFDCGSGYGPFGASSSATCNTATDGPSTLSVGGKVRDDDGDSNEYLGTVTVDNVDPSSVSASFGSPISCSSGSASATLSFSFVDPGADTWDAQIDWDYNGTFSADETKTGVSKSDSASHSYATSGSHTAAIKIVDDDGGVSGVATATVWVNYNLSSILQPVNDTRNGQPVSLFKYGSTIPVKVEITDCGGSHPSNLDVRIGYSVSAGNTPPGTDEPISSGAANTGNQLRFSDPLYIFNLATKSVSPDATCAVRIFVSIMDGATVQQSTNSTVGFKK